VGKYQSSILKDELLSLPSICHLKRFSQSLTVEAGFSEATVKYLKQRALASSLNLRQKLCCLTKSIAPGAASFGYDEDEETSKTVLCFMITGIASSYCDIVCMVPLSKYHQLL